MSGIRDRIEGYEGRLTKADKKLVSILLSHSQECTYLRAHDIADRAGVHKTAAVRLAQKLGFKGYPELRLQIQQEFQDNSRPEERVQKRLDRMTDAGILHSLIESEVEALRAIPETILQSQIDRAVTALLKSVRVAIFGRSHFSALADLMSRRLNRSGYKAISFHHIDWEIPEIFSDLKPGDVLLAYAFRQVPEELDALINYTKHHNITSIMICDQIGPLIRPQPDIMLSVSRGPLGGAQSLTVPMAISNALVLELSDRDGGKSIQSLGKVADIKREYQGFIKP